MKVNAASAIHHKQCFCNLLLAIVFMNTGMVNASEKPIYGHDQRMEISQSDTALCIAKSAVMAIFPREALSRISRDQWQLTTGLSLLASGWCVDERFATQPTGVFCTAFLISTDRIATAAHCINAADDVAGDGLDCANALFVFDYQLTADGELPTNYDTSQVYACAEVTGGKGSPIGADWRVVQLDRDTNRAPLPLYTGNPLPVETTFVDVIGHPLGLPMKAATNGVLLPSGANDYFLANIDTYEGNSGSPVLIRYQNLPVVIGLLSSGALDFFIPQDGNECKVSKHCDPDSCQGERVTSTTVFADWAEIRLSKLADAEWLVSGDKDCE